MAVASFPLRREEIGVRGRVRDARRHESPLLQGAQGRKGLRRAGATQPGQEHDALIASITLEGAMGEGSVAIEGATDAEVFEAYVERFLSPTLSEEGQVVVLDGLGAHRTQRVKELIEARGAYLLFLPSYSPDYEPYRGSVLQDKRHRRAQGGGTYPRGAGGGDRASVGGRHA